VEKQESLTTLDGFGERLTGEVLEAFRTRGSSYGRERFDAWKRRLVKFLDQNFPGQSRILNAKLTHYALSVHYGESEEQRFWRQDGEIALSYIDSLKVDIEHGEYETPTTTATPTEAVKGKKVQKSKEQTRVFIVHGHDELTKVNTARFVESLGFKAIILHEQVSNSMTIIEKIETYTDVDFAIVLYTADDKGESNSAAAEGKLKSRARQNVVFEHGYLMGKLGRGHVVPLVSGDIELPGDISGVVYVSDTNWQITVAREMKSVGLDVDFNKLA
jgi:predicted nucleotide-binding protein